MKRSKKLSKGDFKPIIIKLEDLNKLNKKEQINYFEDLFGKIYSNEEVESINNCSLKCVELINNKEKKIRLPYEIIVQKNDNELIIKIDNTKHWFIFILLLGLLLLTIMGASYSYYNYSTMLGLNKDIDNDGIADINLDLNNDRIAEINVDTNKDNKPDYNIDYKGNRKPVFNIDTNHNGKADYNLINNDLDNDGICDLNCDLNGDGWPDINLDIDGDLKADIEIDFDNDGKPDINFDLNLDMVCDLHCDTDGDKVCDKYCIKDVTSVFPVNSGSSKMVGNKDVSVKAGDLVLEFDDQNSVIVKDIFPDDQLYYEEKIPTKKFKVMNKSGAYIMYNLRWVVTTNDYETDNFKYSVKSTLNGANLDFVTAPKKTSDIAREIIIAPYSTQEYEVDFKLEGTHQNQNIDEEKTFAGHIEIYLDNEN